MLHRPPELARLRELPRAASAREPVGEVGAAEDTYISMTSSPPK